MSDEAVVRVVLVDGAGGVSKTGTAQSSTTVGSTSSSAQLGTISAERMFREMTRCVTDINKGFNISIQPVVHELQHIKGLITKAYDYSDKEYKEVQAQTLLLKSIGAALGASQSSTREGITSSAGQQSTDKVLSSNKDVVKAIDSLGKRLKPDEPKGRDLSKDVVLGMTAALVLSSKELTDLTKLFKGDLLKLAYGVATSPRAVEAGTAVADFVSDFDSMDTLITMAVGGALAGLASTWLFPKEKKPDDKPKDIHKEISATAENTKGIYGLTDNILSFNQMIELNTKDTVDTLEKIELILGRKFSPENYKQSYAVSGKAEDLPLEFESDAQKFAKHIVQLMNEGARQELVNPIPIGQLPSEPIPRLSQSPPDFGPARHGGPAWPNDSSTLPIAIDPPELATSFGQQQPPTELHQQQPPTELHQQQPPTELHQGEHPDWANWVQPHHGQGWNLLDANKQEMIDSGFGRLNAGNITIDEYNAYVAWRRANPNMGPPGFAQGGAVGTDTIPAMLSPGEVVVPKSMVDGGAVDHLRGSLPGFAGGGMIGAGAGAVGQAWLAKNRFITNAQSETGGSISQIGGGISAVGEKLGAALPMVGAFVKGMGAAAEGFGTLVSALNQVAERYGEYSGEIAQAQAIAEVQQTMGDIRRAQEISAEMAEFVIVQGEMQQKFEDIKVKLLMQLVPAVTRILEILDMGINVEGIQTAINGLMDPLSSMAALGAEMVNNAKEDKFPEIEDPTTMLRNPKFGKDGDWVPRV